MIEVVHRLKTSDVFFRFIWERSKTFEIRKNDRNFNAGDHVVLEETEIVQAPPSPYGVMTYTGRVVCGVITYITDYEQQPGYVVFSFRETSRVEKWAPPSTI